MKSGKKRTNQIILLSNLIDMENPQSVIGEVKITISMEIPDFDFRSLNRVYFDILRVFRGEFPGYRKCNTDYHDLKHTTDTFLSMARLIHGYLVNEEQLSEEHINLGLISALMHDTGYIQTSEDSSGTGAKYTREHISRSIIFMENYFASNKFSKDDFKFCKNCISCTGININFDETDFSSHQEEIIGKMLGTSDLLSQMSARNYLEKLLFLYYEFREGNILGYESELDLLNKTIAFYNFTKERFARDFENLNKYMLYHFKERWNTDKDLYNEGIEKNIEYLKYILDKHKKDYQNHLRRSNISEKLQQKRLNLKV